MRSELSCLFFSIAGIGMSKYLDSGYNIIVFELFWKCLRSTPSVIRNAA